MKLVKQLWEGRTQKVADKGLNYSTTTYCFLFTVLMPWRVVSTMVFLPLQACHHSRSHHPISAQSDIILATISNSSCWIQPIMAALCVIYTGVKLHLWGVHDSHVPCHLPPHLFWTLHPLWLACLSLPVPIPPCLMSFPKGTATSCQMKKQG